MRTGRKSLVFVRISLAILTTAAFLCQSSQKVQAANQIDIHGPNGSGNFGDSITVLPNGNIVVTDPGYDRGFVVDVGAVYLYDGASGAPISMLGGSTAGDRVGLGGVTVLDNGSYVIRSPAWSNNGAAEAGAATWGDQDSGVSGDVSPLNSLVGSTAGDQVGENVMALSSSNYLVNSPEWDNGEAEDAGAVTWGDGDGGVFGEVSAANSLVGSSTGDRLGTPSQVDLLGNGNYLLGSWMWDNGSVSDAGAVTWGSGTGGTVGAVSASNSLVGISVDDHVGMGVILLDNGDYAVLSNRWDNGSVVDAGAVTWGDGESGTSGEVSPTNSLVGSSMGDEVGGFGSIHQLNNGNLVIKSRYWDNGLAIDAGAVTWVSGTSPLNGAVSALNSLVGSATNDMVGNVHPLANGNYVVSSPGWDEGMVLNVGAVTWADGSAGIVGAVSPLNSLVGCNAGDLVGDEIIALSGGNYVVESPGWDGGALINVGAVTWGEGRGGLTGPVSALNSLVGSTSYDQVGNVNALSNGNYVVSSSAWDNGTAADVGAVTWGDGSAGVVGEISPLNSLVGSTAGDHIGQVTPLDIGNFVVWSQGWDDGAVSDVGAVTWVDGGGGMVGPVSALNSLVGSTLEDRISSGGVRALNGGNYLVESPHWDYEAAVDAGAITWGSGTAGLSGAVSASNSLVEVVLIDTKGYTTGWITPLENGSYLVIYQVWNGGRGSVTWGDGNGGVSGEITALNSLVGATPGDSVGGVKVLSNRNYLVIRSSWHNGQGIKVGAVTWGDGTSGITGEVTELNSLVGASHDDGHSLWVNDLDEGGYAVISPSWDDGWVINAGAVTWSHGATGISGLTGTHNSVTGTTAYGGSAMFAQYDPVNDQLVVGRPADNVVTLVRKLGSQEMYLPLVVR